MPSNVDQVMLAYEPPAGPTVTLNSATQPWDQSLTGSKQERKFNMDNLGLKGAIFIVASCLGIILLAIMAVALDISRTDFLISCGGLIVITLGWYLRATDPNKGE
jgi:hypothetical protein